MRISYDIHSKTFWRRPLPPVPDVTYRARENVRDLRIRIKRSACSLIHVNYRRSHLPGQRRNNVRSRKTRDMNGARDGTIRRRKRIVIFIVHGDWTPIQIKRKPPFGSRHDERIIHGTRVFMASLNVVQSVVITVRIRLSVTYFTIFDTPRRRAVTLRTATVWHTPGGRRAERYGMTLGIFSLSLSHAITIRRRAAAKRFRTIHWLQYSIKFFSFL